MSQLVYVAFFARRSLERDEDPTSMHISARSEKRFRGRFLEMINWSTFITSRIAVCASSVILSAVESIVLLRLIDRAWRCCVLASCSLTMSRRSDWQPFSTHFFEPLSPLVLNYWHRRQYMTEMWPSSDSSSRWISHERLFCQAASKPTLWPLTILRLCVACCGSSMTSGDMQCLVWPCTV